MRYQLGRHENKERNYKEPNNSRNSQIFDFFRLPLEDIEAKAEQFILIIET